MQESISRKNFLKNAIRLFRNEMDMADSQKENVRYDKFIYPPGIKSPQAFLENCTQSYHCISVCPYEALQVYREDENDKRFGYPVIAPRNGGCHLCEDFPCISACQSQALHMEYKKRKLGTAVILENKCIAYHQTFCQSCIFNCPYSGEAIYADSQGRPVVNEELCTGCGICTQSCPLEEAAIQINGNKN
jgi:MauM/NapG family ferredoxin protein